MMAEAFAHRTSVRIEWGDCDPAGIVFYPNYFRFCNGATDALFAAAGFAPAVAFPLFGIVGYPMIDTRARFLAPNRFGDEIALDSAIARWGRSSFDVRHQLSNADGLSVEVSETRVWAAVDADGKLYGLPVPTEVRSVLVPLQAE